MVLIFAALILGLLVGRFLSIPPRLYTFAGYANTAALLVLLFTMGVRIGADPITMANIPRLGWKALLLASGAVAGSILAVNSGTALYRKFRQEGEQA